jgi:hypothetical protein
MTNLELVLNMLAEANHKQKVKKTTKTFADNKKIARKGGEIAGNTESKLKNKRVKKLLAHKMLKF